jgi:hypothetical protein
MAAIFPQYMTAEIDGDFVIFVIGMRINRRWKIHKWLPVALAMPRMLKELEASPESGFLGAMGVPFGPLIQYWRSFEHLERFAQDRDGLHWPAWTSFNKKVRAASGDVGIFHETYVVKAGNYEAVYGAMPRIGWAAAGRHEPAAGRRATARGRLEAATAPSAASSTDRTTVGR